MNPNAQLINWALHILIKLSKNPDKRPNEICPTDGIDITDSTKLGHEVFSGFRIYRVFPGFRNSAVVSRLDIIQLVSLILTIISRSRKHNYCTYEHDLSQLLKENRPVRNVPFSRLRNHGDLQMAFRHG